MRDRLTKFTVRNYSRAHILKRQMRHTVLWASPGTSERGLVDVELGFPKSTGRDGTAGVGYLLEECLGGDEVVYQGAQSCVLARSVLVDDSLEDERRIARPGVQIVGVRRARASDDNARLRSYAQEVSDASRCCETRTHLCAAGLGTTGSDVRKQPRLRNR